MTDLTKLIERYETDELIEVADLLDKKGLHKLASRLDDVLDASTSTAAIEGILSAYESMHSLSEDTPIDKTGSLNGEQCKFAKIRKDNLSKEEKCPFSLPIPLGCMYAGEAIFDMVPGRDAEAKNNRRIYNKRRTHGRCPYAATIIEDKNAVDCNHGTTTEGRITPKMYRASPIYPKLFEGFNTINLDRNYHQYHDFSYYSIYG